MFTWLRRVVLGPPGRATRMTQDEAMALAAKAAEAAGIDRVLGVAMVRRVDGRLTWIVSTATKGSGWSVSIDDATGEAGPVKRWGIR
jgi:hypothetical protein